MIELKEEAPGALRPHGGRLAERLLPPEEAREERERARGLRAVPLGARQASDLEMLAVGAYSPLSGFMVEADYRQVVAEMRLSSGLLWSLPITLSVGDEVAAGLREGQEVALWGAEERPLALLRLEERYRYDKETEAEEVFGTKEEAHPGVRSLFQQGEVLLGGEVSVLSLPSRQRFPGHELTPAEARRLFAARGWRTVVGFQTRNPVHRAHEYLQKCALEMVDGLLLHPLVGDTKEDDIPAEVRMRCYQALLENYYPRERVVLSVLPAAMRYAGPREAVFHALVRKNYGCTHFIVGRDHAGVGNYYGTYDAHRIFSRFSPGELGIQPIFFDHAFYCRRCQGMASAKTCPHDPSHHLVLSGTKVRAMLQAGELPPAEFTRPEVAAILLQAASS